MATEAKKAHAQSVTPGMSKVLNDESAERSLAGRMGGIVREVLEDYFSTLATDIGDTVIEHVTPRVVEMIKAELPKIVGEEFRALREEVTGLRKAMEATRVSGGRKG